MSQIAFDNETGQLSAPETAAIRQAVATDWVNAFNTGDGSPALDTEAATPAGQLIDAETAYIAQANSELMYLANMFDPRKAEGVFQDALGAIYFLTRKVAQPTSVICTCTGLQGSVIPAGAQAQDVSGNRYQCSAAVTISASGSVSATFEALVPGAIECPANTLTTIITVIAGWDTISNPASGVTGRLEESQTDFETRRFKSVAQNAHGSAIALEGALESLDGVVDCLVLENDANASVTTNGVTIPGHSVAISIYGGDDGDIAQTIYEKKSGGCGTSGNTTVSYTEPINNITYTYQILRPTPQDVSIVVSVDYVNSLDADYQDKIKAAVLSDFLGENTDSGNSRVTIGQTVYASRFSTAVLLTAGVRTLRGITIALNGGAAGDSIDIPANVEPVLSADDITVQIVE